MSDFQVNTINQVTQFGEISGFPKDGTLSRRPAYSDHSPGVQSAEVSGFPTGDGGFSPKAHKFCVAQAKAFQLPHRG